jgi:hypothetical protein
MIIGIDPIATAALATERTRHSLAEAAQVRQANLAVRGRDQTEASRAVAIVWLTTIRGARVRMWRAVPRPNVAAVS